MSEPTLAAGSLADVWIVIAAIAAWLALMCLKTLGHACFTAVRWHDLKVEAHNLRLRHRRELMDIQGELHIDRFRRRAVQLPRRPTPDPDEVSLADAA